MDLNIYNILPDNKIFYNPLIANVFFRAGLIEIWGRGTISIMNDTINWGIGEPSFSDVMSGFEVGFFLKVTPQVTPPKGDGLSELESRIIEEIKRNIKISRSNLAKLLNISEYTVKEYTKRLREKKYLDRIGGNTRAGSWTVTLKEKNDFSRTSNTFQNTSLVVSQASPPVGEELTELESRILGMIKSNKKISKVMLSEELGISAGTVKEYIKRLRVKGCLKRVGGNTRAGIWVVYEKQN